jgi:hypothetical protein
LRFLLEKDDRDTVSKFAAAATDAGLFVRRSPGNYIILPPNRVFTALSMRTKYDAQIIRLNVALRMLNEPHLFICYGAAHYSRLGINEVHLGISEKSESKPEVGGEEIFLWRLSEQFFEKPKELMGPRRSFVMIPVPRLEDEILLLGYARSPRFDMMMEDIIKNHDVNADYLLGAAPSLRLTDTIERHLADHKRISMIDVKPNFARFAVQLPEQIITRRTVP